MFNYIFIRINLSNKIFNKISYIHIKKKYNENSSKRKFII